MRSKNKYSLGCKILYIKNKKNNIRIKKNFDRTETLLKSKTDKIRKIIFKKYEIFSIIDFTEDARKEYIYIRHKNRISFQ